MRLVHHLLTWLFLMVACGTATADPALPSVNEKNRTFLDKELKESETSITPVASPDNVMANLEGQQIGAKSPHPVSGNPGGGSKETLPGNIKAAGGNKSDCKFQVSVLSDATYCVDEEPCSGSGPEPSGKGCPMNQTQAVSDCHCFLTTFVSKGVCMARQHATCAHLEDKKTWGCIFDTSKNKSKANKEAKDPGSVASPKAEDPKPQASPDAADLDFEGLNLDSVINGT